MECEIWVLAAPGPVRRTEWKVVLPAATRHGKLPSATSCLWNSSVLHHRMRRLRSLPAATDMPSPPPPGAPLGVLQVSAERFTGVSSPVGTAICFRVAFSENDEIAKGIPDTKLFETPWLGYQGRPDRIGRQILQVQGITIGDGNPTDRAMPLTRVVSRPIF
jgi:hypothetical protein